MTIINNHQFTINKNYIIDANNNKFIIRGINYLHTWYKNNYKNSLLSIQKYGTNTVRIVLSNGQKYILDDINNIKNVINTCIQYKLIIILEIHDTTGSNNVIDLENAIKYWIYLKPILIGYEDKIIINIANEWFTKNNDDTWIDIYKKQITILRQNNIKHLLIIDCPGYGQYTQSVLRKGKEIILFDNNVIFSIHIYEYIGLNKNIIKETINSLINNNIPIIIGEFGCYHNNKNIDFQSIMDYSQSKNIGWLSWSWYGNNKENINLDMTNLDGSLTKWGYAVIYNNNGIKQTSITCSIYT